MDLHSDYYRHWSDAVQRFDRPVEDDMAARIRQLEEEVTTLKATLIMVRRVVGTLEIGSTANANSLIRLMDALGDV